MLEAGSAGVCSVFYALFLMVSYQYILAASPNSHKKSDEHQYYVKGDGTLPLG